MSMSAVMPMVPMSSVAVMRSTPCERLLARAPKAR
jgi:hypothetical protein